MDTHRRESLTRKHLAERRRRAKINYYLDEIEALISPPVTKGTPVKMEKAELLEKTVAYLRALRSNGKKRLNVMGVDFRHFRQLPRLQTPRVSVYSPYTIPPMVTGRTSRQDDVATDSVSDVIQPLNLKTQPNNDTKEHNSIKTPEDLKTETQDGKPITDNSSAEVTLFSGGTAECDSDIGTCDTSLKENLIPVVVKQESNTDLSLYKLDPSHLGNIVWRPWKKIV
ncbi:uncharacterized protein LOC124291179 [Haliotis rubra]|uniref:uncharacterized protein LOC124291179 n=1 Tax=Haliotis rubra TaxID=36100 RepID=UPI001EE608A1|nr:uncharacterized protein LOC124291179 [Haliotis rubra]